MRKSVITALGAAAPLAAGVSGGVVPAGHEPGSG